MTLRQRLLAFAVCVPIAIMGAKCDPTLIACPPLKKYSDAQYERMLNQYEHVEESGMAPDLINFVNDHIDLRDAVKKCIAARNAQQKKK